MLQSDEPGLYLTDKYGIRCENLILCKDAMTTEFGHFLEFEPLTLFPFDLKLMDTSIMTDQEIKWINDYHKKVRDILTPYLSPEEATWMAEKTIPLAK